MQKENMKIYIDKIEKDFKNRLNTKQLLLEQIKKFVIAEEKYSLPKSKYKIGDYVFLKKGTFMHGIREKVEKFDYIIENGFVNLGIDDKCIGKYPFTIGFWNIQQDIFLKDYIYLYSGATVEIFGVDGLNCKKTKLVPLDKIEEEIKKINNSEFWKWDFEQTKEVRFLPSLAKTQNQIAFIINTESEYAKKIIDSDIFKNSFNKDVLKDFVVPEHLNDFISLPRDDLFTNRESAIIFGMPSCFIEGVLVGRIIEKDKEQLRIIKEKFPNVYICNLDGEVIVE